MRILSTRFVSAAAISALGVLGACAPAQRQVATIADVRASLPPQFADSGAGPQQVSGAVGSWQGFFRDPDLQRLIGAALTDNQELNIILEEIEIARNEATARRGEYLPSVAARAGGGVDKVGRFTRNGAVEHQLEIAPDREFPEPLTDLSVGATVTWEVDVWGRLRNATKAAVLEYLASAEGRRFMETRVVAEVARTYYELIALDQRASLIEQTIALQTNMLSVVRLQRDAGRVTELAVRRFEGELQGNRAHLTETQQQIVEAQNRLHFLLGRYPSPITRAASAFTDEALPGIDTTLPTDLLLQRPDVHRTELELAASGFAVQAARARFLPSVGLVGGVGVQSFEGRSLFSTPASLAYGLTADLVFPLVNRQAISAEFRTANARQIQALYEYQRTLLGAYLEVSTQFARIRNIDSSYVAKTSQVAALLESIQLADQLFRAARSDYLEVLLTQRDALEAQMELVELRQQQLDARVTAFQALGGGACTGGSCSPAVSTALRHSVPDR